MEASAAVGSYDALNGRFSYGDRNAQGLDVVVSGSGYSRDGRTFAFPDAGYVTSADSDRACAGNLYLGLGYRGLGAKIGKNGSRQDVPAGLNLTALDDDRTTTDETMDFVDVKYNLSVAGDRLVLTPR